MGSSSSKAKPPQQNKANVVEKKNTPADKPRVNAGSGWTKPSNENNSTKTVDNGRHQESKIQPTTKTHANSQRTGKNKKNLGNFDSDSDSEEEDIDAVLEATRNEYNNQANERNRMRENNNETSYPETYAQRLQREQYKQQQAQGLVRQKTIYRNPQEWDQVDDILDLIVDNPGQKDEDQNFDVSRFKQANVISQPPPPTHCEDIFTPPGINYTGDKAYGADPYSHYNYPKDKKKSLPHYDMSEEALLDEIEKEYEL